MSNVIDLFDYFTLLKDALDEIREQLGGTLPLGAMPVMPWEGNSFAGITD
jgi:hypothetical protein